MSGQRRIGGDNTGMSARQAAKYIGVPYKRFLAMRDKWGIKTYRAGQAVMVRRRELDSFVERGGSMVTEMHHGERTA
jgi:excisionase family DNA binding protein